MNKRRGLWLWAKIAVFAAVVVAAFLSGRAIGRSEGYPWHYDIVATNFWVGQVISPASDGS